MKSASHRHLRVHRRRNDSAWLGEEIEMTWMGTKLRKRKRRLKLSTAHRGSSRDGYSPT